MLNLFPYILILSILRPLHYKEWGPRVWENYLTNLNTIRKVKMKWLEYTYQLILCGSYIFYSSRPFVSNEE